MKGSREYCGIRISEFGFEDAGQSGFQNPQSEIRNPKSVALPFWKIAHPMMWDLRCLPVVYSRITSIVSTFENPGIGIGSKLPSGFKLFFRSFFWAVDGINKRLTYA
jgi:hypothetical protein